MSKVVIIEKETMALRRGRRWIKRVIAGVGLLAAAAVALCVYAYPAIAAAVCPSCYGFERITPHLVVNSEMPAEMRDQLQADARVAQERVRSFYGAFEEPPTIVACSTKECDRRMGGRGARAVTMSMSFMAVVRVSPDGVNTTILTHEFSHVQLHREIGIWSQMNGAMPAWFDEGLAVVVSNDFRYVKTGATAQDRCKRNADGPLPTSPSEWAPRAGKDNMMYADAACRVLKWMEANGGRGGVLRAINAVARGVSVDLWTDGVR